jgi:ubiquinone/menaquinone biosynthesis C-methylase UbiE
MSSLSSNLNLLETDLPSEAKAMSLARILEPEVMDSADEAADYDSMDHREVNQRFVTDLLAALPSAPSPEPRTPFPDILDLGTGTAQIPIELCRRHADCRVMAADAAVSMLELARYNLEIESLTHRIELAHVDAKRLPFREGMFDVVMSNSIIHHIPEPIDVVREAVRVTREGGLLFFRDLLRPETEGQLRHLVATYAAGANDHQQRMFAESLHAALALDEIRGLISSLDFSADGVQPTSDRHWTWSAPK